MSKKYIEARRQAKRKRQRTIFISAVASVLLISIALFLLTATPPWVISVNESFQKISDGAFLLDVRDPQEYEEVHIPDAHLIPLDQLASRIDEVPKDEEVVVYCRTGNRSRDAYDILSQAGYTNVTSIDGGIYAWAQAGYEVVAGQ